MPPKLSDRTRGEILYLRAIDYDKSEIAAELGISRNTVRRHLDDIRAEAEETQHGEAVIIRYLFESLYEGDPKTVPELLIHALLHDLAGSVMEVDRLLEDPDS